MMEDMMGKTKPAIERQVVGLSRHECPIVKGLASTAATRVAVLAHFCMLF